MDIDHFKKVNDSHGHQVGDDVLAGIAAIIRNNIRKVDIVARYGGEEFVAILSETDEKGAFLVVEKLRKLIEAHEFETSTHKTFHVTASFGISSMNMLPKDTADKSSLMVKMADDALYSAKEEGRNRAVFFQDSNLKTDEAIF
jgi:diguanylate cyclase (GGDEF)-like protein